MGISERNQVTMKTLNGYNKMINFRRQIKWRTDMVAHECNPSTYKIEAEGQHIEGQPGLHSHILY